jgi:hypothetical protein
VIYCTFKNCRHYKELEKPVLFQVSKLSTPFPDDWIEGCCDLKFPNIMDTYYEDTSFKMEQPLCTQVPGECYEEKCAYNSDCICCRDDIIVGESLISHDSICKCFSVKKIKGHWDWSRNLNSDGTAKGGHISDSEANKYKRRKQF